MIEFFLKRPPLTVMVTLIFLVAGLGSLGMIRKESFPNVEFASAKITTAYPGASPEDVEELVTQKIEDELRGIDGLKEVKSISSQGRSEINIRVDLDNANVPEVMDELKRAADRVTDLPREIEDPPLFQEIKTKNMPVLEVAVHGNTSEKVIRQTVDQLEDSLENLKGVASINKVGYRNMEFRVLTNPKKLRHHHVSLNAVADAVRQRNLDLPGGTMESFPIQRSLRTRGEVSSAAELKNTVIRTNLSGQSILVSDVASLEDGFQRAKTLVRINGEPGMVLTVAKKENGDQLETVSLVKDQVASFRKSLPEGLSISYALDESKRTRQRLDVVISNSIIGFGLVIICLLVFLNWRASITTSLSMPIIVLATVGTMQMMGISFNLISMLAIIIALGMLVDNSIVVSENIHRYLEQGLPRCEAALKGCGEIFWPVCATAFTTIAAFAPMLVTKGVMGEFIWSIPVLLTITLLLSLFESFLLLPTRSLALAKQHKETPDHWIDGLRRFFEKTLRLALDRKWLSFGILNGLLFFSFFWAANFMDFILFPPEGVDTFVVRYEDKVGTPIEELQKKSAALEKVFLTLPDSELVALTNRSGIQQLGMDDPQARQASHVGMIQFFLTDEKERSRRADQIIDDLREKLKAADIPLKWSFQQLINGPPVGRPITVSILGQKYTQLEKIQNEITSFLEKQNGVYGVDSDFKPGLDEVSVRLKPDTASLYGIQTTTVARTLRMAHEGEETSTVTMFGDEIDVRVMLDDEARADLTELRRLPIADQRGNLIPLETIASITEQPGPGDRRHTNLLRSITITADVKTDVTTSMVVNNALRGHFADLSQRYPGYSLKFGGEDESTAESVQSLFVALIIAAICIFGILVALFNSFSKPMLIMYSIPFGFIGVVFGFSIHQKPLGFLALIGTIGLAGVVVNSSIIMMSVIESIKGEKGLDLKEALIQGASQRLRPILLTTITTVSALLPTAYGLGGWDPMLVPMTLALAWGLMFGTTLTLVIVPVSSLVMDDLSRWGSALLQPLRVFRLRNFVNE